jgi:hypothetical protein
VKSVRGPLLVVRPSSCLPIVDQVGSTVVLIVREQFRRRSAVRG